MFSGALVSKAFTKNCLWSWISKPLNFLRFKSIDHYNYSSDLVMWEIVCNHRRTCPPTLLSICTSLQCDRLVFVVSLQHAMKACSSVRCPEKARRGRYLSAHAFHTYPVLWNSILQIIIHRGRSIVAVGFGVTNRHNAFGSSNLVRFVSTSLNGLQKCD